MLCQHIFVTFPLAALLHSYHLEMSYRENFPLFLLSRLVQVLTVTEPLTWTVSFHSQGTSKLIPSPFLFWVFFPKRPFPALDLDSFFSHPFQLFIALSPKVLFMLERKFLEISAKLLHCFSPPTYGPSPSRSHPLTPPPGGYKYHKQLSFCCVKITTCISDWYWVLCFTLLVP